MKTGNISPEAEVEVWMRILHPDGEMTSKTARAILDLNISESDVARMHELAAKARTGALTLEEDAEKDNFERVGSMLAALKSRARQVLKRSLGSG